MANPKTPPKKKDDFADVLGWMSGGGEGAPPEVSDEMPMMPPGVAPRSVQDKMAQSVAGAPAEDVLSRIAATSAPMHAQSQAEMRDAMASPPVGAGNVDSQLSAVSQQALDTILDKIQAEKTRRADASAPRRRPMAGGESARYTADDRTLLARLAEGEEARGLVSREAASAPTRNADFSDQPAEITASAPTRIADFSDQPAEITGRRSMAGMRGEGTGGGDDGDDDDTAAPDELSPEEQALLQSLIQIGLGTNPEPAPAKPKPRDYMAELGMSGGPLRKKPRYGSMN